MPFQKGNQYGKLNIGKPSKRKGKKLSIETRKKMEGRKCCWEGKKRPEHSELMKGNKYGKKEIEFLSYSSLHRMARNLFYKGVCEICGISEQEKRLEMHCSDKKYKNMENNFWTTCCKPCHIKLEKQEGNRK